MSHPKEKKKANVDISLSYTTHVQMVGPCGEGVPCLSMHVDQRNEN